MVSTAWSFTQQDMDAVSGSLSALLKSTSAHSALVLDRSGQLLTVAGRQLEFDTTSFATLAAADFSANDQMARLIGEDDFIALVHEGEKESMYITDISHRLLLVILFDRQTTLTIVRMMAPAIVEELTAIFGAAISGGGDISLKQVMQGAEHEIDRLFQ